MNKIDPTKKYRYRDGRSVQILCTNRTGSKNIVSMAENGEIVVHFPDGTASAGNIQTSLDLIEVKEPRRLWVNIVLNDEHHLAYGNRPTAATNSGPYHSQDSPVEFIEVVKDRS